MAVAPELVLINASNRITYDVRSTEHGIVFFKPGMVPVDRAVSPAGAQVDIQAASYLAEGTVTMLPTGPVLRLQEGIVFDACG